MIALGSCTVPTHREQVKAGPLGVIADTAMVVSAHPAATAVGVQVLRDGGNAMDAAVAVHWTLAVVLPWAGNIGGGGFMVVRDGDGRAYALDFRETAPAAAHRDLYLDAQGAALPEQSLYGHRAVGVPGSVAGLFALHDSLGRLPMHRLIRPAIDLARNGVVLTRREAEELMEALPRIRQHSTAPNAFTSRSQWSEGDTLVQPELARTLERIRDEGANGFYGGTTADLLVAEMQRGDGLITHADLRAYRPSWRAPVRSTYRDVEVIGMPPPSSGGVLLMQLLGGMEPMDVRANGRSAATLHRMIEVERRAYADRATHLGDPAAMQVSTDALIDSAYIAGRMAGIDPRAATPSAMIAAGSIGPEHDQTTHFSIVDGEGNAVACTTTLNGGYGSCVVVGGAGFVLNNEMDDFSVAPGVPNMYGLVGGEVNAVAPGHRMLSSMTPTIVTRNGKLFMVLGTPGGSTIITSVFQVLLNVIDHGMGMQQAVNAPRFHHQWLPDVVFEERGAIPRSDSLALTRMGHRITVRPPIGRVDAVLVLPDGRLEGGADPRGDDEAAGY